MERVASFLIEVAREERHGTAIDWSANLSALLVSRRKRSGFTSKLVSCRWQSGVYRDTGNTLDVDRLLFVRRARALGLSLPQLKILIGEFRGAKCATIRPRLQTLVVEQLGTVRHQIVEFQALERELSELLRRLEMATVTPDAEGCRCLDEISGN